MIKKNVIEKILNGCEIKYEVNNDTHRISIVRSKNYNLNSIRWTAENLIKISNYINDNSDVEISFVEFLYSAYISQTQISITFEEELSDVEIMKLLYNETDYYSDYYYENPNMNRISMEILQDICNHCGIWTEKLNFNMDDHYFYIRKRDNMSIYHDISNSWNIEIIKKLIMSKPEWLSVNELFSCCVITENSLMWNDIYYTQKKIQKCFDKYGYFQPTIKDISEFNRLFVFTSSHILMTMLLTLIEDGKYLGLSDIIQVYYHHGGKAVK